jgi:nitrite reductase/ring-hydroxylating ferredoxin subunit/uncharacterized membrane protein
VRFLWKSDVARRIIAPAHERKQTMSRSRVAAITRFAWLDHVASAVKTITAPIAGPSAPAALKDALNGVWLGHPLHPLVVAVPIGAWTSAALFDVVGHDEAADGAVAVGIAGALASAVTGAAQYFDASTDKQPRRVGALHATLNASALTCYIASAVMRAQGKRDQGRALAMAGLGFVTGGGLLGGDLSYTLGIGVDHTAFEPEPGKWTDAVPEAELPEGKPMRIEVEGAPVMLVRQNGAIYATSATCTHLSGPLEEGTFDPQACTITCPWHGSVFDVRNGDVIHGPATAELPRYDVQVENGRVKVRAA